MTRYFAARPGIALLLGVLCPALGMVVFLELVGTGGEDAAGPAPVVAGGAPPLPPQPAFVPLAPLEAFTEVIRRPLFSPTRQPSPEAIKETQGNANNFALLGVIISDDGRIALIQHGRPPAMMRLMEGQAVEGWTVHSILPDRVTLRRGTIEQQLWLKDRPGQLLGGANPVPAPSPRAPAGDIVAVPPTPALPGRGALPPRAATDAPKLPVTPRPRVAAGAGPAAPPPAAADAPKPPLPEPSPRAPAGDISAVPPTPALPGRGAMPPPAAADVPKPPPLVPPPRVAAAAGPATPPSAAADAPKPPLPAPSPLAPIGDISAVPPTPTAPENGAMRSAAPADAPKPPPSAPSPRAPSSAGPAAPPPPAVVAVAPTGGARIFIQVGTYAMADNAAKVKSRLDRLGTVEVRGLRIKGTDFYRVRLGPIANIDEAHKLLKSVVANGIADARIVVEPPPGPSASPGRG